MPPKQVCKFYPKGQCKFGDLCKFLHVGSNAPAPARGWVSQDPLQVANSIRSDLDELKLFCYRPTLLSYGYGSAVKRNLIEGRDFSPDEARLKYLEAVLSNTVPQYEQHMALRARDMENCIAEIRLKDSAAARYQQLSCEKEPVRPFIGTTLEQSINDLQNQLGFGSSGFGSSGFGSSGFGNSGFGSSAPTSTNSGFGSSGFGSSGFGNSAPTSTNSGFGSTGFGNSGFGSSGFSGGAFGAQKPGAFGLQNNQSAFGSQSAFGQKPALLPFGQSLTAQPFGQSSTTLAFGQNPSSLAFGQAPASLAFGQQTSSGFGSTGFGKPAGAFGQQNINPTNSGSGFGSSGFGSSGFGQNSGSAFGQNSGSAFGSTGFGAKPVSALPFGGQQSGFGQSGFGQSGTGQSGSAFGAPPATSAFGQPQKQDNPFGQPQKQDNPFGQPPKDNPFGQPQKENPFAQNTGFGGVASNTSQSPFGALSQLAPQPENQVDLTNELGSDVLKAFQANQFELGRIPEIAPPSQVC